MVALKKALFLDRDGVINRERGEYTHRIIDFELLPSVIPTLKKVTDLGYLIIIITNQGGIAKGVYTHTDVNILHEHLTQKLTEEGIKVDDIFYAPQHPHHSKSLSRKPGSLMFEKAIAIHHIAPKLSFMIGDSSRDVIAGENVGVRGFLIPSNSSIDFILSHLK